MMKNEMEIEFDEAIWGNQKLIMVDKNELVETITVSLSDYSTPNSTNYFLGSGFECSISTKRIINEGPTFVFLFGIILPPQSKVDLNDRVWNWKNKSSDIIPLFRPATPFEILICRKSGIEPQPIFLFPGSLSDAK